MAADGFLQRAAALPRLGLRFDALGQRFHGTPEEWFSEELVIEVVATDNDGVAVSGTFVIRRVGIR